MHRECKNTSFVSEDFSSAIALMDIQVYDQNFLCKTSLQQVIRCNSLIVEQTETFTSVGKRMVSPASDVHGNPVLQRKMCCQQRSINDDFLSFYNGVAKRKTGSPDLCRSQSKFIESADVIRVVSTQQPVRRNRIRMKKVAFSDCALMNELHGQQFIFAHGKPVVRRQG